ISGSGSFTKAGSGTLTIAGDNTFNGTTFITAGTLLVNGSQPNSPISLSGGILGGTGNVSVISASAGTVSPGASPGILTSSNVSFSSGMAFKVELNGTTAGVNYDQLNVTGTVNLADCALNVSLGFTPALSNSFVII